jgi:hypothetical protein
VVDKRLDKDSGASMTITDANTIDLLATRPGSSEVQLIVSDHLDWADIQDHCRLLQEKLNRYLAFIESGEANRHPQVQAIAAPTFSLKVISVYEVPAESRDFFDRARDIIQAAGVRFIQEHRPRSV